MECEGKEVKDEIEKQTGDYRGSAEEVTGEVGQLADSNASREIMSASPETQLGLSRDQVLNPLIEMGFIEMTIPGKPTSSKQKYRLTEKGREFIAKLGREGEKTRGKKGEGRGKREVTVPEGWETETLRDLATINYGKSPAQILTEDGPYPVVGTGGNDRLGNDYLYDGDSIILGRKGTIDRVYFATGKFWTIDTAYYLSDFSDTVPRWLYYALQSIDLRQMNEATGVPSLSRDRLYRIELPTPPKAEQAKITEVLSTVDRAIEQTEALIDKQQRIKTGLMQDLLTRGIDEHGNLRSERTHKFKDSPLGRIPAEWEIQPISNFGCKTRSWLRTGPFGSDLNTKHWQPHGVPVLTIGSLGEGRVIESDLLYVSEVTSKALEGFRVEPGDIVFSRVADIGRSLVVQTGQAGWIISSNLMRISLDLDRASPEFLYRNIAFNPAIKSQLRMASNFGGRELVNGLILKSLLFPWPRFDEQERIVLRLALMDGKQRTIEKRLNKITSVKTALMQGLLTGRKRVSALLNNIEVVSA